ncbi:DUF2125 domain-containing protein [Oceanibium sediminis]|uniref:DUF2125 domain-containing protein n=1 Tax=Oceanibium sediminis TaxID=2026339 RepID=UPI000DD49784|nr:DUF2125 domain-containing protein [Oceanibium sediminis]
MMRNLLILVLALAFGWGGYWFVGSSAKHAALTGWLEQQRAAGWVADVEDLRVTGFPNRFDTIITELNLADPHSGWSWSAPMFQILALSYTPTHVIAVWPETQTIASPAERITIASRRMRGSVRLSATPALALKEARIELDGISAQSSLGWTAGLADGQLAVRETPDGAGPDNAYDISLKANALRLPRALKATLDPADLLPPAVTRADIRVTPVYSGPWNRYAVEQGPPDLETLNVGNITFEWGIMRLTVTGRLDADELGYAEGSLNIIARNWPQMLDVAVRGGWIPPDMASSAETALALLARATGETDRLDVTLTFKGGTARLGPIPIGRAPRMN